MATAVRVYVDEVDELVLLNCIQGGEMVVQLVLDADEALEHACAVLRTALAVKRRQARARAKPKLEVVT